MGCTACQTAFGDGATALEKKRQSCERWVDKRDTDVLRNVSGAFEMLMISNEDITSVNEDMYSALDIRQYMIILLGEQLLLKRMLL